ncbi:hypothetical protein FE634_03870 [Nocardioides dongxiaopingii]|uniref:hypothetical protein n=1 Tax=Nocardioides sp. S-1144 TaxID=2582905 RepID=UPI00110F1297|nr:hypothetical protein [Nocardioides sp. S-1144]QCW49761.1 hypothetical protein FE634_03870 [Nocardioides sp. S-1144]
MRNILGGKRPSGSMVVSVAALVVALGGTSYAAVSIGTKDLKEGAVTSPKIRDGAIRMVDLAPGVRQGTRGPAGADGQDGADAAARWLLVDRSGTIVAQSGGFAIRTAYDLVNNSGAPVPAGALGNVYIDANEDLSDNAITVSVALQNKYDQNADGTVNGRAPLGDANPEFSGEVTATVCGITDIVACAPTGADTRKTFVVSPRLSDGTLTVSGADVAGGSGPNTHKRFYVSISGDSSDYVEPTPAVPAVALP